MISALDSFDKVTAAGIVARAALSIDGNPSGSYRIPGEERVRDAIISEARKAHGIESNDVRPEILVRIGEILDSELDLLISPSDANVALERLSNRGELPSDLFKIEVIKNVSEFHGWKYANEEKLIEITVRSPDREQHFGEHPEGPEHPFLISLFSKQFPNRFPGRTFTMLVAGQRLGLNLIVHHAWRIYASAVELGDAQSLVDVLRKFAESFGVDVRLGGKTGRFIYGTDLADNRNFETEWNQDQGQINKRGHREVMMSCFWQHDPITKKPQAALAVAIDLVKYRRLLESQGY